MQRLVTSTQRFLEERVAGLQVRRVDELVAHLLHVRVDLEEGRGGGGAAAVIVDTDLGEAELPGVEKGLDSAGEHLATAFIENNDLTTSALRLRRACGARNKGYHR